MKRSINFSSIFRRKEDQAAPASDQTDQAALADRILGRSIKLARDDLSPVSADSPPVDRDTVDGHIMINETFGLVIAFHQMLGPGGILYNPRLSAVALRQILATGTIL